MDTKPYRGKYPGATEYLMQNNCLRNYPRQIKRDDLLWDEGIDIVYDFKTMTPEKFREHLDAILLAAATEARRYMEYKWKFVTMDVEIQPPKRKSEPFIRTFTAAKNPDPDILVYGIEGVDLEGTSLQDKIKTILDLPNTPSGQDEEGNKLPYKVKTMIISIRLGLKELLARAQMIQREERIKELEEGKEV